MFVDPWEEIVLGIRLRKKKDQGSFVTWSVRVAKTLAATDRSVPS